MVTTHLFQFNFRKLWPIPVHSGQNKLYYTGNKIWILKINEKK